MCLIVLAIGQSSQYPLIVAANRDEFHGRPTRPASWWADKPDIVGGRDLQAGGTWLALHRSGRFAAVTNYREAPAQAVTPPSRGHLVSAFLEACNAPLDHVQAIDGRDYAGFNLLVGDDRRVAYVSNRGADTRALGAGIYGLGNALLDADCAKVSRSKARLEHLLSAGTVNETELLRLLDDRRRAAAADVPNGSLDFATRHALTAPFIVTPDYGTRSSTVVLLDRDGTWWLTERQFNATGDAVGETRFSFAGGAVARVDRQ